MSDNVERFCDRIERGDPSLLAVGLNRRDIRAMLRVIRAAAKVIEQFGDYDLDNYPEDYPDEVALRAALRDLPGGEPDTGGKDGSDE